MISYSFNAWNHSPRWDGRPPTLPAQITAAAAAGYDYFGPDIPSLLEHEAAGLPPAQVRDILDRATLPCYEIGALSISADTAATEASLRDVVRFGTALDARQVLAVVHSGMDAATIANTRTCVAALAAAGMGVAIEFLPSLDVFNSINGVVALIEAVDHPELRVMVDSWHFFAGPSTWESLDALPLDRIGFVQFSDASPPITDDVAFEYRERRVLPGEGVHDVTQFASRLCQRAAENNHHLTVSVEILSKYWRDEPIDRFTKASYDATRRMWEPLSSG
jgi:4-hydroxyphenylpyruvate dioxygenase